MTVMDVLFRGAMLYDGSGAEGVRQDAAVRLDLGQVLRARQPMEKRTS